MQKVVLCLVFHTVVCLDCTPGRLTGIPCPSSKDVIRELQPAIGNLKDKITSLYKSTQDTAMSTHILIQNNIIDARNLTNQSLLQTRSFLNQAKIEASKATPRIRKCVTNQSIELNKIHPGVFSGCKEDFTTLQNIRRQILFLEQHAMDLIPFCSRLNPLEHESGNVRTCVEKKIHDLQVQLSALEKKFSEGVKEVVSLSTSCIMRNSAQFHAKIGAVEGAVKNCKNVGLV